MNFNKLELITAFNRAAETYAKASVLQQEVAVRLLDHLDPIIIKPKIILDLGAKTGFTTKLLKKHFPEAQIIALDISEKMLQKAKRNSGWFSSQPCIATDIEQLACQNNSVDLIFSNLALHWCNDLSKTLQEVHRVLRPQGLFIFTTYGPDTLKEVRESWARIDNQPHVHEFIDMHNIGDALLQTNFSDPVMEMEYLTMTYKTSQQLFADLKNTGNQNLLATRCKTLTGKNKFQNFLQAYETFRQKDGTLPATFEIIYGHAWKKLKKETNEITISIDQIMRKSKVSR